MMAGSISRQLELLQQSKSRAKINRYQLKELESVIPSYWSVVKKLDTQFDKCSPLFDLPNEFPFNSANQSSCDGITSVHLPRNIEFMDQKQLSHLDDLVTLFLDLSLAHNMKNEVQVLIKYLIYSYQANTRYSVNLLLYVLPRHLSSFYLDIVSQLVFPRDSTFRFYKINSNPSRELITEITIKHFNNYQQLSTLARRLCIERDRDEQNSEFLAFFNSIHIEFLNRSGCLRDNHLRFFITNAIEALRFPQRRNYYNTYLCGISIVAVKNNISIETQNDIINSLYPTISNDSNNNILENSTNLKEIILLTSTLLEHQSEQNKIENLPIKWTKFIATNSEYQRQLLDSLKELIEMEIKPLRFCEILTTTILGEVSHSKLIDEYATLIINLIAHFNQYNPHCISQCSSVIIFTLMNKLESICSTVDGNICIHLGDRLDFFPEFKHILLLIYQLVNKISLSFPRLYHILIRPLANNNNENLLNFLNLASKQVQEVDSTLELDNSIQYISNISIFEPDRALNFINLALEKFQYWSQSNIDDHRISTLASKLVSLLPNYQNQILNSSDLWQFISRMDGRDAFVPHIYSIIKNIMYEIDNMILDSLCNGIASGKEQLFTNDYLLLEYCLSNFERLDDLFTCIDIITQISTDHSRLSYYLTPISIMMNKLKSNQFNGRLKSHIVSTCTILDSINCSSKWIDIPVNSISDFLNFSESSDSAPVLSINILMEYLNYLCSEGNCIENSGKIVIIITALIALLDRLIKLAKISLIQHFDKIPLVSTLASLFHSFSFQFVTQTFTSSLNSLSDFQQWVIYNILAIGCTNDIFNQSLIKLMQLNRNFTPFALNLVNSYFKIGFISENVYKYSTDGQNLSISPTYGDSQQESLANDLAECIGEKTYDTIKPDASEIETDLQRISCPGNRLRNSDVLPVLLYKKLLDLFNISNRNSTTSAIVSLIYFTPLILKWEFIEPTLEFIKSIFDCKCNFDIAKTFDLLVEDGFLVSSPMNHIHNLPKSDISNLLSDLFDSKNKDNVFTNFLAFCKILLSKHQKATQSLIYLSYFLPSNILVQSNSFYKLINLKHFVCSSTFKLINNVSKNHNLNIFNINILLNVTKTMSNVAAERLGEKNFSVDFVKNIIFSLSTLSTLKPTGTNDDDHYSLALKKLLIYCLNLSIKYSMLQHLDDDLLSEMMLLFGEHVCSSDLFDQNSFGENLDNSFRNLLNLLKEDAKIKRSYQVANVILDMSDHLSSANLLPEITCKLEIFKGDLKILLFLIACKIALKYPAQVSSSLKCLLVSMGIDCWWDNTCKHFTETSITFIEMCNAFVNIDSEVSKFIVESVDKLSNSAFSGLDSSISDVIKKALSNIDSKNHALCSRRTSANKTALMVWNSYSNGNVFSKTDSNFTYMDYFIYSTNVLRTQRVDRKFYQSLDPQDKIRIILSLSYLLNIIDNSDEDIQSKFDILAEFVSIEVESGVLQISTSAQCDKSSPSYEKIGLVGDICYNLLMLIVKYESSVTNVVRKTTKLLISKTHLLLNTPHLILAILDYPYYYSPNEEFTISSGADDIPIILELFKLLTNTFNQDNNTGAVSDSLKGLEVSHLYYKISLILSKLYPYNPHIILKSLIFLVKIRCSDLKTLKSVIYPLVSLENENTKNLPKQDVHLLCKLLDLSAILPRAEVVLKQLGLGMLKTLIILNRSIANSTIVNGKETGLADEKAGVDPVVSKTIAMVSSFINVTFEVSRDLFYLSLANHHAQQVAIRRGLLKALAKSLSLQQLAKLIAECSSSSAGDCICGFNLLELYISNFRGEIVAENPKITQIVLKLITECDEFGMPIVHNHIHSATLDEYIEQVACFSTCDFFSLHVHLGNLLIAWLNKTTLLEMASFFHKIKNLCNVSSFQVVQYRHLFLYIVGVILCELKKIDKEDSILFPIVLPVVNASFTCITDEVALELSNSADTDCDLRISCVTLSLVIINSLRDHIIPAQLMGDVVESLFYSIYAFEKLYTRIAPLSFTNNSPAGNVKEGINGTNGANKTRGGVINGKKRKVYDNSKLNGSCSNHARLGLGLIESILATLITDENNEIVCKSLVKQLSLGPVFLKKTLLSSLFNIWSRVDANNTANCSEAHLIDRLTSSGRELSAITRDLEFDGDDQVASLAKNLRKRLEFFTFQCNELDIDEQQ